MRRTALAALALVALLLGGSGCGLLRNGAYDLPLPGGADTGANPTSLTVHFSSVDGLVPKSMVKVGNIAVGQVDSIDVDPATWTASVHLRLRSDVALPANAIAQVRRSSLLGEWYVELAPPASHRASAPLVSGASIPIARTTETAPVEQILGALSLLLNDGGVPQLNDVVHELNHAFGGRAPQLRALLGRLDSFTGRLDRHRGDIVRALDALDRLSRTLVANRADIAAALDELPGGVKVLADQRGQLVAMLRSLGQLSDVAVDVVHRSSANTIADLRALAPTLTQLARAGSDVPDSLRLLLTFPFPPGAAAATQGDFVNLDNNVDLDLGTLISDLVRGSVQASAGLPSAANPLTVLTNGAPLGSTAHAPQPAAPAPSPSGTPSSGGLAGLLSSLGLGGRAQ